MQLARIAVLALALTHAVGLAEQVRRATCEEACNDDGCDEDCGPNDAFCRCHAPLAQLLAPSAIVVTEVASPTVLAPCEAVDRAHASPDPREILHVPRLVG